MRFAWCRPRGLAFLVGLFACLLLLPTTSSFGGSLRGRPRQTPRVARPAPAAVRHPVQPRPPREIRGPVLLASEVNEAILAAAAAISADRMAVAVVDRVGTILAIYRTLTATDADAERAVGLARTAAFFSNNKAPLSSRTVRFISGIHFPPGVKNTPNAALYGIENTNRGCDFKVTFNPGVVLPPARSAAGILASLPCESGDTRGCGLGIVTGKLDESDSNFQAVDPGGVPIFRPDGAGGPEVLGGIGVAGGMKQAEAEFAAFMGAQATKDPEGNALTLPVPVFPLPAPRNVFIDGIRLPFVDQVRLPAGSSAGTANGAFDPGFPFPLAGPTLAPEGYLVGPLAGTALTLAQVQQIVDQSIAGASRTRANIRLPLGTCTSMVIAVADLDGKILALFRMDDATVFSIDVAVAKARNVVYFSSLAGAGELPGVPAGTAVTNRTIGFGAQPLFPPGIDLSVPPAPGPFFGLFQDDFRRFAPDNACTQGNQPQNANQSGIVFFPGSTPLYLNGQMVGGLGVSGDGVEQDDYVTFLGAAGFLPPESIRANQFFVKDSNGVDVRLPYLKFPRNPEACTP